MGKRRVPSAARLGGLARSSVSAWVAPCLSMQGQESALLSLNEFVHSATRAPRSLSFFCDRQLELVRQAESASCQVFLKGKGFDTIWSDVLECCVMGKTCLLIFF